MINDKNAPDAGGQTGESQPVQNNQTPINPFREADAKEPQQSIEEETALEQQRKEALTERD